MAQAREALDWYSFLAARDIARIDGGDVVMNLRKFRTLPEEIARRLLVRALMWIGGDKYPPRRSAMNDLLLKTRRETSVTLAGCRVLQVGRDVWICREYQAVRRLRAEIGEIWDQRWRLHGGEAVNTEVRALGRHGLMMCGDWRTTGRPHAALGASPAVWRGDELVAAPLAGKTAGWQAELIGGGEDFFASLLSH
jgi:tRNA(Ile)-lysidine synthase